MWWATDPNPNANSDPTNHNNIHNPTNTNPNPNVTIVVRTPVCCPNVRTPFVSTNISLRPTRVHNPNGKSISSAIFAQLMAECRRVHWRHLANTIESVLPSAHPRPQPRRQIERFSRFCIAHVRKSRYFLQRAQLHCKRCISYGNSLRLSICLSVCLSVRLSVRLSHAGIVSKRRHVARCSFHRWIARCV